MTSTSVSSIQKSYKDDILMNFTPGAGTRESFIGRLHDVLKTYRALDINKREEIRPVDADSDSYSKCDRVRYKPRTLVDHLYDALKQIRLKEGESLGEEVIRPIESKSAPSTKKSFKYDVFLSFRGEDTRKNFVDHLYHALKQKSIYTYKDDEEIEKGKMISEELTRSIEDSKFYIIVFSKNYASSSWCLDELVKIMECQKSNNHTAYPVFYDVEPTEVRKQSGAVEIAFAKHVEEKSASVEKWRVALTEAANLAGWELKTTLDGHEARLIQKIVKDISQAVRYHDLSTDEKLIGLEKRVKDVLACLKVDVDDVRIIGIKGIGGGGKTTLAKAVFDQIYDFYDGSSFVENVRESTKRYGLKSLQRQVLSDVLQDPQIVVSSAPDLKGTMKKIMAGRKMLLVLDDVDDIKQLEALVGDPNWFGPGSRVIITTRDKQVLDAHGVLHNFILEVNLLSMEEANRLFNMYAFGREILNHDYDMLSRQFVIYAAGLPLSIKTLGSLLRGKDKSVWTDELERLKTIPLAGTLEILELSYNSLENDRKEIFLDVACILKGWKKEKATRALESRGFHAVSGLKDLEQKSLIVVSDHGYLSMHDKIEEMGRNIVRRLNLDEPYSHSRLWIPHEVEDILVEDKGTKETTCIIIQMNDPLIVMKGLRKMKELKFLDVFLRKTSVDRPDDKYNNIGEANNLVGLEMRSNKMDQLWKGGEKKDLKKLRFFRLYGCNIRTLDIGLFPNLERLSLKECKHLATLHVHVQSSKLKFLSLYNCQLKTLDLARAQNLEKLTVGLCRHLVEFHMPVKILHLKYLHLESSKLKTLNLTLARNLEKLTLDECEDLVELHMPVEGPMLKSIYLKCPKLKTLNLRRAQNVETLNVVKCESLVELHMPAGMLKLEHLVLLGCSILKTVNVTGALKLEVLNVIKCEDLVELRMPLKMLKLRHLCVFQCFKLKTLNLTGAPNIEVLEVIICEDLAELHMPIATLKLQRLILFRCFKLETLNLMETPNLKVLEVINCKDLRTLYLGASPYIKRLALRNCYNLVEIHAPIKHLEDSFQIDITGCVRFNPSLFNKGCPMVLAELHLITTSTGMECQLHPDDYLHELKFQYIFKEPPPSLKGTLEKSISVNLRPCSNLTSLLGSTCGLQCLTELTLVGSNMDEVSIELGQLECLKKLLLFLTKMKHLKLLRLTYHLIEQFLEDLGRFECLEELHLEDCWLLQDIPRNTREMRNLKALSLEFCYHLKTVDLTWAPNVESLYLSSCLALKELHMPVKKLQSLHLDSVMLKTLDLTRAHNLINLHIGHCKNLVKLHMPSKFVKLECLTLVGSKLKTLCLAGTENLKTLFLNHCDDLEEIHMPVEIVELESLDLRHCKLKTLSLVGAQNLKTLSLSHCEDLEELHMPVDTAELESLDLCRCKLKTLDLVRAQNLQSLVVKECDDMAELHMPVKSVMLQWVFLQHCKLRILNLTQAQHLEELYLSECEELEELHMPVRNSKLRSLDLNHSKLKTLDLTGARNLNKLRVKNCDDMVELHMPIESVCLNDLTLKYCSKLRTLNLTRALIVKSLCLKECEELEDLHMPVEGFELKFLNIKHSKLKTLHLSGAQNLINLNIENCKGLVKLRMPIENSMLESLNLYNSKLKTLDLIGAQNLKKLRVKSCDDMVELHMPAESLMLKDIALQYCCKLETLDLTRAQNLNILDLTECEELEELHIQFFTCLWEMLNLKMLTCVIRK